MEAKSKESIKKPKTNYVDTEQLQMENEFNHYHSPLFTKRQKEHRKVYF